MTIWDLVFGIPILIVVIGGIITAISSTQEASWKDE